MSKSKILAVAGLIVLFALIFMLTLCGRHRPVVWEDFEGPLMWTVATWDNAGVYVSKSDERSAVGNYSLKFSFIDASPMRQAICMLEKNMDWSSVERMNLDVYNDSGNNLFMSLSLSTGEEWEWFESRSIVLEPGWNRDITFDFEAEDYKAEKSRWQHTLGIENIEDVRRVSFLFRDGSGDVYIDNIRLEGYLETDVDQLDDLVLWEGFESEETLWSEADWRSQAVSVQIINEKATEGNSSLKCTFENITEYNKATFCVEKEMDWSEVEAVYLDVYNDLPVPIKISAAISTGGGWIWYESPDILLGSGWNKDLEIDLNRDHFKAEATNWENTTYLRGKEEVQRFAINVMSFSPDGLSGSVYIDNIRHRIGEPVEFPIEIKPQVVEIIDSANYDKPVITEITAPSDVDRLDRFEFAIDIDSFYNNPYNPEEIDITAEFTSPSGKKHRAIGFFYQGYDKTGRNVFIEKGEPEWRVRFAPSEPGRWQYSIIVNNPAGETRSDIKYFDCSDSDNPGFIVTKPDSRLLWFDNGEPYFAVGQNLGWVLREDEWSFADYFKEFHNTGQNWTRIWNCPWGIIVEWGEPRGKGLGQYSQEDAYRFDNIIDMCEDYGIYFQMVINYHGMFKERSNWTTNPYNFTEGGPCENPEDFFTDAKAKEYFKRRLRYFIARYGYSPSILAWELFNEVDLTDSYDEQVVTEWHKEMIEYIREIDPHNHLITTSFARPLAGDPMWRLPDIDFTQIHVYTDEIINTARAISSTREKYEKPSLIAEIGGAITDMVVEAEDREGIRILDALWSPLMTYSAGTAMFWWWDGHIKENNLNRHFASISGFLNEIDIELMDDMDEAKIDIVNSDGYADLIYAPPLDWEKSTGDFFEIDEFGNITGEMLSRFMHGDDWHQDMKVNPVFEVYYPEDGNFSVHLLQAAQLGATLEIYLNNEMIFEKVFPGDGRDIRIDRTFSVDIPAGHHRIKVANSGEDWMNVGYFNFSKVAPRMNVLGIQDDSKAVLWFKNREYNVENYLKNIRPNPVRNGAINVNNLKEGIYSIKFYDVINGEFLETEQVEVKENTLELNIPQFSKSLACIIEKIQPFPVESYLK